MLSLAVYKYPVRTAQITHSVSVIKTSQLMLYREIIAVCSQIHTKHINTLCGLNVEFVNVKPGGLRVFWCETPCRWTNRYRRLDDQMTSPSRRVVISSSSRDHDEEVITNFRSAPPLAQRHGVTIQETLNLQQTRLSDSECPQHRRTHSNSKQELEYWVIRLRLKCEGTRAETRFRLSAKRTSPLNPYSANVENMVCP